MPPTCLHPADPNDPLNVAVFQLDNGLQIWLSVHAEEPRIFSSVVARVGSGEDPPDATGLAHYMEHMLANKGSQRLGTLDAAAEAPLLAEISDLFDRLFHIEDEAERTRLLNRVDALECEASRYAVPNELKQAYARMGGRGFNATTSKERTNYFVDIPANMLERWMMLESDRFRAPVFRAFFSEVQTVVEEKNRSLDDAGRRSAAALDRLLWGAHPYATEILGHNDHLARPRVSRMRQFYTDWMVPGNMAVVLAGDLDVERTVSLVDRYFGDFVDRPTPPRASADQLEDLNGEQSWSFAHHGAPAVHLAWRTVAFEHPDRPALRMADMLLDNGKTGLIDTELNAAKRVRSAGAYPRMYRDGGAQIVWARPLAGQSVHDAKALLLEQVERLKAGELDAGLLDSIFLHWKIGELAARESNQARAGWMTSAFVHRQTWSEQVRELERHRAVTVADIQRVARTHFGSDRVVVYRETGTPADRPIPTPSVTARKVETQSHSAFFDEVLTTTVQELEPRTLRRGEHWLAQNGAAGTVYSNRNPHSDLCQVSWVWDQGYEGHPGRSYALRLWALSGVGGRTRVAFDRWIHGHGVRVGAHCGRHDAVLSLSGPSDAVLGVVDQVWDRLWTPEVEVNVAEAYLRDSVARRQVDKETKKALVGAARGYALYGSNSTALAHSPSDDVILNLLEPGPGGRPVFHERLRSLCTLPRDLLYTGTTPPEQLLPLLCPRRPATAKRPERNPIQKARTSAPKVIVVHHASKQASVTVYRCVGPHRPERLLAGTVYSRLVGGSAGLCFQELREARGLAYATSGGLSFGSLPGDDDMLWAHAETHPAKAATAAGLLVDILARPVHDDGRFVRAQADALQSLRTERIRPRGIPGTARWWDQHGYDEDPRPLRLQAIARLTRSALEDFRAALSPEPPVLVVVGDTRELDLSALGALGALEERSAADLFCY